MELIIYQRIDVRSPTMLATWPGMGNVAIGAIDYIRRKLELQMFAEIDTSKIVPPDAIIVEDGMARLPRPPRSAFYYRKNPDLIIFEGESQLRDEPGVRLISHIIKLAKEISVSRILTAAAFPLLMSYEEPSIVYGVANTELLRDALFSKYKIRIMESGQISGLNGLLLGYAKEAGIGAACLLATIPLYAVSLPNPKASKAIVIALERILGIGVPMLELDMQTQEMESKLIEIEAQLKEQIGEPPITEAQKDAYGIPEYIRQKIERLFKETEQDKSKAYILKRELDKWNLFDEYEDRFLDLFKEH
ncbi:MAG: PAC2 family protein [bacterium]|nr:PAC2 family protein [bacterium]